MKGKAWRLSRWKCNAGSGVQLVRAMATSGDPVAEVDATLGVRFKCDLTHVAGRFIVIGDKKCSI